MAVEQAIMAVEQIEISLFDYDNLKRYETVCGILKNAVVDALDINLYGEGFMLDDRKLIPVFKAIWPELFWLCEKKKKEDKSDE